jgi:hypothetical protein
MKKLGQSGQLHKRVREILESARKGVARTVNTTQVVANWLVGREIVEEEQRGKLRAGYGDRLLLDLSRRLQEDFGRGYSVDNLEWFREFYLSYSQLVVAGKSDALRRISGVPAISDAPRRKLEKIPHAVRSELEMGHTACDPTWQPGQLHSTPGDHPTLGLILCTDKNDAVVRYTLGPEKARKIFASRYKLHLPSVAELKTELKRELRRLGWPKSKP